MTTQRLPGTDAARYGAGDADLTIMLAAHQAFRRDLARLVRAVAAADLADPAKRQSVAAGWASSRLRWACSTGPSGNLASTRPGAGKPGSLSRLRFSSDGGEGASPRSAGRRAPRQGSPLSFVSFGRDHDQN